MGSTAYAVDLINQSDNGQRPNNDLWQVAPSVRLKQELSARDAVFLQAQYAQTESGDLTLRYDHRGDPEVRIDERLEPLLLAGYHHAWAPWSHTLLFASWFQDTLHVADPSNPVFLLLRDTAGAVRAAPLSLLDPNAPAPVSALDYRSESEVYSTELQQLLQAGGHGLIAGARFQIGTFDTSNALSGSTPTLLANNSTTSLVAFASGPVTRDLAAHFQRVSVYAYDNWRLAEPLLLTAGLTYDWLYYPVNFRHPPTSEEETTREQISPKAGLLWNPWRDTAVRAAYTRSLGGASFEQSLGIEPTQVGGFNQAYRSLIPESVAGAMASARFETADVALDQRFDTGTYLSAQGEWLHSKVNRELGTVDFTRVFPYDYSYEGTSQRLDYHERTLLLTFNQLLGRDWSFGARYRLSEADLNADLVEVPIASPTVQSDVSATLHQVNLFARFNHPSGFFSEADALWSRQSNRGYSPDRPGDDFWQFNVFAGYRFYRRHAELRLGLLNIADRDYQLNPLNLTEELPRQCTVAVSFRFNF